MRQLFFHSGLITTCCHPAWGFVNVSKMLSQYRQQSHSLVFCENGGHHRGQDKKGRAKDRSRVSLLSTLN